MSIDWNKASDGAKLLDAGNGYKTTFTPNSTYTPVQINTAPGQKSSGIDWDKAKQGANSYDNYTTYAKLLYSSTGEKPDYGGMMIDPGLQEAINIQNEIVEAYEKQQQDKLLQAIYPVGSIKHVTKAAVDALEKQAEEAKVAKQGISSTLMATPDTPTLDAATGQYVSDPYWLDLNKQYEEADKKLQELDKQFNETRDMLYDNEQYAAQEKYISAAVKDPEYIGIVANSVIDFPIGDAPETKGVDMNKIQWLFDAEARKQMINTSNDTAVMVNKYGPLDYITQQEKNIVLYYVKKGDWKSADEYLDILQRDLDARAQQDLRQDIAGIANQNVAAGIILNVTSAMQQPLALGGIIEQNLKNAITGEYEPINYNNPWFTGVQATQATAEGLTREIESPFWKWTANAGLSLAQYAATLPFGPQASLAIMATSSAGAAGYDAAVRGASPEQALQVAAIAGVTEALTEKIPLDNIFKIFNSGSRVTIKQALLNMAKQGGQEGFEEFISAYANVIADNAIMGDKSNFNLLIEKYAAQGYSGEEAVRKAMLQTYVWDPLSQAAAGGLTGFAMAGTGHVGKIDYSSGRTQDTAPRTYQGVQSAQEVADVNNTDYFSDWYGTNDNNTTNSGHFLSSLFSEQTSNRTASTNTVAGNTSVDAHPSEQTLIERTINNEYASAVNDELHNLSLQLHYTEPETGALTLGSISNEAAAGIKKMTGINTAGFETVIEQDAVKQIINEHGKTGTIDNSMMNINDIARMQYVIDNYDTVVKNSVTKPTSISPASLSSSSVSTQGDTLIFEKKVNDTYYVVEAVPDVKTGTINVQSAYLSETSVANNGQKLANKSRQGYNGNGLAASTEGAGDSGKSFADVIIRDGSQLEYGKLKPNVTYQSGEYDYIYKTNEDGLITNASTDSLQIKNHSGRLNHNPNTYGKVEGDQAGHLFGDRFGGSPELDNLVSQAKRVNQSEFKILENHWARALKNRQQVAVDITINYANGGVRPVSFDVSYTLDGVPFFSSISN